MTETEVPSVAVGCDNGTRVKSNFTLQVVSDLHLEHFRYPGKKLYASFEEAVVKHPDANAIALVGDIGCVASERDLKDYEAFLQWCADCFELVFVVHGNHEMYSGSERLTKPEERVPVETLIARIQEVCDKIDPQRVLFLNRKAFVTIPDQRLRIAGACLWSHIPVEIIEEVTSHLNDYEFIWVGDREISEDEKINNAVTRKLTADDTNAWHAQDLEFLIQQGQEAEENHQKLVFVTHYIPTFDRVSHPRHDPTSSIRHGFATDLEALIESSTFGSQLTAWICGHSHYNFDKTLSNGVRIVSNQVGYPWEALKAMKDGQQILYDPSFVLKITWSDENIEIQDDLYESSMSADTCAKAEC
eukprot:TRINITY_DN4704_c0_g1_i2.p1 TRINITY_DN4704_c0_g1~~TRINITY_DN4704_c0_g1_i2.p1  ORF type:complete len:367 (-),score=87.45 TRINITY_DN4704_c0_g1_i2:1482-2558(-)